MSLHAFRKNSLHHAKHRVGGASFFKQRAVFFRCLVVMDNYHVSQQLRRRSVVSRNQRTRLCRPSSDQTGQASSEFVLHRLRLPRRLTVSRIYHGLSLRRVHGPRFMRHARGVFLHHVFKRLPSGSHQGRRSANLMIRCLLRIILLRVSNFHQTNFRAFTTIRAPAFASKNFPLTSAGHANQTLHRTINATSAAIVICFRYIMGLYLFRNCLSFTRG